MEANTTDTESPVTDEARGLVRGTASGPALGPPVAPSPLDRVLEATLATSQEALGTLDRFLTEPSPWHALAFWLGGDLDLDRPGLKDRIAQRLTRDVGRLDTLLSRQVNAILHHSAFQRLEASWRGLRYLVGQVPEGENVKVRVLSVTWKELTRDLERALEFDQSQLFKKVYGEEFGTPGGEPYGILLGDYEVRHRPGPDHPMDDMATLGALSQVAAAAFAPFIVAAHPLMLDLASFADLEQPLNLSKTFEQREYVKWKAFRDTEDSRFLGVVLPRIALRLPYGDDSSRLDGFRFKEEVTDPGRQEYLWGNAAYAFGGVVVRAFVDSGWLAAIRGVQRGRVGGGLVAGLPSHAFETDRPGLVPRSCTDAIITDAQEKELADLGFIPLCHCQDTDLAVFYGNQSAQKPKVYDELSATINARLSAMLQYMLCVARFAHYLKVMCRDKVGSFKGPGDCEEFLNRWLGEFTTSTEKGGSELKARYPLREGRVQVREWPDKPGSYMCVVHLRPHFQLDQLVTAVKLVTQLAPSQPGTG
jgi:type VI secretion system ImpC/EvpB family protein